MFCHATTLSPDLVPGCGLGLSTWIIKFTPHPTQLHWVDPSLRTFDRWGNEIRETSQLAHGESVSSFPPLYPFPLPGTDSTNKLVLRQRGDQVSGRCGWESRQGKDAPPSPEMRARPSFESWIWPWTLDGVSREGPLSGEAKLTQHCGWSPNKVLLTACWGWAPKQAHGCWGLWRPG